MTRTLRRWWYRGKRDRRKRNVAVLQYQFEVWVNDRLAAHHGPLLEIERRRK